MVCHAAGYRYTSLTCLRDQEIVNLFQNRDFPEQPDLELRYDKTTFAQTLRQQSRRRRASDKTEASGTDLDQAARTFIEHAFDFGTRDTLLGTITKYKERYAYKFSLGGNKVMKLSHLLSQLVDAAKQGLLFYDAEWDQFRRRFALPPHLDKPAYDDPEAKRQGNFPIEHILDWLFALMSEKLESFKRDFDALLKANPSTYADGDLTRLHDRWSRRANEQEEARTFLNQLRDDIHMIADDWPLTHGAHYFTGIVRELYERWVAIEPAEDFQQYFPPTFIEGPNARHLNDFALLKASVTFKSWGQRKTRFAFHIASRQLCWLKALSKGQEDSAPVVVVPPMYSILKPDRRQIERLAILRRSGERDATDVDDEDDDVF